MLYCYLKDSWKKKHGLFRNTKDEKVSFISKEDKKILKRVIKLFKPFSEKIIYSLVCMFISAGISFITPLISMALMDDGLLNNNLSNVIKYSLAIFFITVSGQAIELLEVKYESYLSTIVPYELTLKTFKKTLLLKLSDLNKINNTQLMGNISMDVKNICSLLDRQSLYVIMQIFNMIGGILGLLMISWKLTIVVILIVPLRYFTVKNLAKKRKKNYEEYMNNSEEYWSWYGDTLNGVKEIKLLGIGRVKIGEFIKKQRPLIINNVKFCFQDKINYCLESITLAFITNILYILGAWLTFSKKLSIGGLLAFITYSVKVTSPISTIAGIKYNYINIIPSAKRFFEFMDMESEETLGKLKLDKALQIKNICFKNIYFSYNEDKWNLSNINFNIRSGEKVAIVGMNGAGKSTLFNLLLRLYELNEGEILINGININDIKLSDYRNLFSIVSQDFYLFNKTIKGNIGFKPNIKENDIYNAIARSGAGEFIEKLDEKINTKVGTNGACLSGGERQKLALARALVSNSKIILFDEGTSNVDVESENKINEVLINELKEEIVLIISHKPKILKYVDKILVLENGVIQDIGDYDELYKKGVLLQYVK
ncbi:ABC transporter ATP-binding protein [Clostridium botulinum]|uniref:ABC transporter ATP-binding protein n=1 Tax=Clostridium botulinum TaxID=1491 RepID=UPI0001F84A76|nr:ABC transporter ATP-binding protein [Clostridium botulinum]KEI84525.1 ABC transporter ATP-binding protein [Clostridium botulinum B2 275]NFB18043.1 ABC transporter ATP-binding protein [Clostridium botulinum]NFB69057.1 ABC transporter ATP-binding protein [Clostridium botulinum]NFB98598.1 ABC transporter ATP-binding protein [Clostridium botulinum]NFC47212.1 ABC transporter ATP-binding protein [Clostridium botulinum]